MTLFTDAGEVFLGIGTCCLSREDALVLAAREALYKPITECLSTKFRRVLLCMEIDESVTLFEVRRAKVSSGTQD